MNLRTQLPKDWLAALRGNGPIGVGHDIATTTKGTSNWSSVSVCQHQSPDYVQALALRWRTDDGEVSMGILDLVLSDIESMRLRPRRLVVDASNEKFHARRIAGRFMGRVPVELVAGGEKMHWKGADYDAKTLLGSLYVAAFEDNLMAVPAEKWLADDHRLVKVEGGRFVADLGKDGGHGDTFDSGKLAYWGAIQKATAEPGSIQAVAVGGLGGSKPTWRDSSYFGPIVRRIIPRSWA